MKKLILLAILASCGAQKVATVDFGGDGLREGMALSQCNTVGDALNCNGVSVPLQPLAPYGKDCNNCIVTTSTVPEGLLASVKCPDKHKFSFVVPRGQKGDTGATGTNGKDGINGTDGDKLTIENGFIVTRTSSGVFKWSKELPRDGVNGTNGTNGTNGVGAVVERSGDWLIIYKIVNGIKTETDRVFVKGAQGPKGDPGINGTNGADGQSCTLGTNTLGQTTITCGSETKVISQCGGGCFSFGARGNVYKLPNNSTGLVPFALLPSPSAVNKVNDFSVFDRQASLGLWGFTQSLTSTPWTAVTDYQVEYSGFMEIGPEFIAADGTVKFRTTTDDSSDFKMGPCQISVVRLPGLNPPTKKEGSLKVAGPGTFGYSLSYQQGPLTQVALALEVLNVHTSQWEIVKQENLTYVVQ